MLLQYDMPRAKDTVIARFVGPTLGRQDPGVAHVGTMNLAIWVWNQWRYLAATLRTVNITIWHFVSNGLVDQEALKF